MGVPWPLVRGFLNFLLLFYYDINESREMKYAYYTCISISIRIVFDIKPGVLSYMVGWSAKIIISFFIYYYDDETVHKKSLKIP